MNEDPPDGGIGPGRLMLIVADPLSHDAINAALAARIRDADVRSLRAGALIVYADAECADVRDWLHDALPSGAEAFVVEFERWSAIGAAIEPAWLLRRGH